MGKTTLTLKVEIEGLRETLARFRGLPKDAANELRAASLKLADLVAAKARLAATSDSPQAALLAPTVKPVRDRVPAVQVGGARRVGRNKAPAWQLLFISEFGANARSGWYAGARYARSTSQQHRPHNGTVGYWFFPLVESESAMIGREWTAAADRVLAAFGRG
ncbi:hypothetical protein [Actinokineospora spheciospongiae]|uniref:hypothetical protein n=1 Tax=Actinokineospora spheciospongiae TaxID=909613 RepID=UPI000D709186|nr:hypothetical protein [Actinokineospora spheciospongiae]PWW50267.1 hypothetical protein DFQ13_12329 [Actinokineospora spheciospongiae]